MAPGGSDDRYEDCYQAAVRYYVHGQTIQTIATQFSTSRSTVSRLLQEAREQGIIQITLADHMGSSSAAAVTLTQLFGVRVHLVPLNAGTTDGARLERVAKHAANLLSVAVRDGVTIGVAIGRTVTKVVEHLSRRPLVGATVIQMSGTATPWACGVHSAGMSLLGMGAAFEAELVPCPLPAFFDRVTTKETMWRERSVQKILQARSQVDVAIFGVGSLSVRPPCEAHVTSCLDGLDLGALIEDEVVGYVCTVLLRQNGSYADIPQNARATGPTPAELRRIPRRICVAADPTRSAALLAALRAGVATDLVLDEQTAQALIHRVAPDTMTACALCVAPPQATRCSAR